MVLEKVIRALQEVLVVVLHTEITVKVIPGNINSIPLSVVHKDIIPHMCAEIRFIVVSEYADTRYIEPVAYHLESL